MNKKQENAVATSTHIDKTQKEFIKTITACMTQFRNKKDLDGMFCYYKAMIEPTLEIHLLVPDDNFDPDEPNDCCTVGNIEDGQCKICGFKPVYLKQCEK